MAGVFSFEDGLKLIAARGRLMGSTAAGAMVALDAEEQVHSGRVDTHESASLDSLIERIRQKLPGI